MKEVRKLLRPVPAVQEQVVDVMRPLLTFVTT